VDGLGDVVTGVPQAFGRQLDLTARDPAQPDGGALVAPGGSESVGAWRAQRRDRG
jgi:hypothetical protein